MKDIIFVVDGGIGKNLASTAVLRSIKKQYPDDRVFVLCGYPDIFINNPHVYRVYGFGNTSNFYEDFVKENKNFIILKSEPYLHPDYVSQSKHLIECWCEQLNVPFDGYDLEFYPFPSEELLAQHFINNQPKQVLVLHGTGGKITNNVEESINSIYTMHARSMLPQLMQTLVDKLKDKYVIVVPKFGNQTSPNGAMAITPQLRNAIVLTKYAHQFILIDSFMQYAATVFKRKAVVLWGGTNPKILGFENNINLVANACPTPMCHRPNSWLYDMLPNGKIWECPYGQNCMRSYSDQDKIEQIISALS